MDETFYDIFLGLPEANPFWLASVKGLEKAKQRMKGFVSQSPGDYFLFNAQTQVVVARVQNRSPKRLRSRGSITSEIENRFLIPVSK